MPRNLAARFALCLSLAAFAVGGARASYAELEAACGAATTKEARVKTLQKYEDEVQTSANLSSIADEFATRPTQDHWNRFVAVVRAHARAELIVSSPANSLEQAKKIKRSAIYRESAKKTSSNWLVRALEKIAKLFQPSQKLDAPKVPSAPAVSLDWLTTLAWILLAAGVIVGVWWAVRQFSWKLNREKKIRAVLEDDEPERSADEWLSHANGLAAQGKYRDAVRSLYLASLVRLDSARLCRFIRSETNWEHYHRLNANPDRPPTLEFLEPTRRFDRVYYGFKDRGMEDVDYFREVYQNVCDHILIRTAR